ncbi:MAG: Coenzyme F420 hydrogenase/dehydrogenase, beta subunit C-terminal domain [Fastidiosipilaceae bacterium]|jgi:coenzyme F420 hydrogenase subunit beta
MTQLKRYDISTVTAEHLCLSCGACQVVCRQGSISYYETVGGYLFPRIDKNTCTNCGLCYEVCPGIHFNRSLVEQTPENPFIGNIISCRVGKATNETIFQNSQSGGIATALLAHLLETSQISGAIVAMMQTAMPPRGDVLLAKTIEEIIGAQKSKYIPIPLLSAVSHLKTAEAPVAVVGLPCHMQGLNNLLDQHPHLRSKIFIKIGLVCDRVQTNAVVDFLGRKAATQNMDYLTFRDKQRPSYPGNPVVKIEGGEEVVLDASLRMAVKDFFTPPRCRLCFDKLNIYSDVVLGDPHGIKGIDRKHGATLVLTRTQRGHNEILAAETAGHIKTRPTDLQDVINGQGIARKRLDWSNYMHAWSRMGKPIPEYPQYVHASIYAPNANIKKYKVDLLHGIRLDNFPSHSAVLGAANRWLLKRKIAVGLKWPFAISMAIASRINRTIDGGKT